MDGAEEGSLFANVAVMTVGWLRLLDFEFLFFLFILRVSLMQLSSLVHFYQQAIVDVVVFVAVAVVVSARRGFQPLLVDAFVVVVVGSGGSDRGGFVLGQLV